MMQQYGYKGMVTTDSQNRKYVEIFGIDMPPSVNVLSFTAREHDVQEVNIDLRWRKNESQVYPNIRKIVFGDNVNMISIPNGKFPNLEEVDGGNKYQYVDGMLLDKEGKKLIACLNVRYGGELRIPEGIIELGANSVSEMDIRKVILPDSLETIRGDAFSDSKIGEISFGKNMKEIGIGSFRHANIETLRIPGTIKKIRNYAFASCPIKTIMFEEGLEEIGNAAFRSNGPMKEVVLPESLQDVGGENFRGMKEIKQISHTPIKGLLAAAICKKTHKSYSDIDADATITISTPKVTVVIPAYVPDGTRVAGLISAWDESRITQEEANGAYLLARSPEAKQNTALEAVARGCGGMGEEDYVKKSSAKMTCRYLDGKDYAQLSKLASTCLLSPKALSELSRRINEIEDTATKAYVLECIGKAKKC